jgi:hypothetical protein
LKKIGAIAQAFAKLQIHYLEKVVMPSTLTLGIITLIIIGSFVVSGYSYARQQALKKRKQMVRKLQLQADEALAFQSLLLKIDASYELLITLQTLVVNALSKALKITPDDSMLAHNLKTQNTRLSEYKDKIRANKVCCWGNSDAELAQAQAQLGQLYKLLDLFRNRGDLSIAQHQNLQSHLKKLQLDFTANSYLYQADNFAEQDNLASYQLYIKQAIQVVKKSDIDTQQKNTRIKELSERINEAKQTGKVSHLAHFIKPATSGDESAHFPG